MGRTIATVLLWSGLTACTRGSLDGPEFGLGGSVGGATTGGGSDDTSSDGSDGTASDHPGPASSGDLPPQDPSTGGDATSGPAVDDSTTEDSTGMDPTDPGGASESGNDDVPGDVPQLSAVCDGQNPSVHIEDSGASELHIFGVYEATSDDAITVAIDRVGVPLVVVLSSYESVTWTLDVAADVDLQEIVLNGYNSQAVEGAGGAFVSDYSGGGNELESCAYAWGGMNGCDTATLVDNVVLVTGQPFTSFTGCYAASAFGLL